MKALNKYILMVLFVLFTGEFIFLSIKPKGVTTQMKALNKYTLIVLFVLLLNKVKFLAFSQFIWTEK